MAAAVAFVLVPLLVLVSVVFLCVAYQNTKEPAAEEPQAIQRSEQRRPWRVTVLSHGRGSANMGWRSHGPENRCNLGGPGAMRVAWACLQSPA